MRNLRHFFICCLTTLACVFASTATQAQESTELFIESGIIPVYEEALNAVTAKERGIRTAQEAAFMQVISKRITRADFASLPAIPQEDIEYTIVGYNMKQENISELTYKANVTVRFHKRKLEKILDKHNIILKEYHKDPILVIPIINHNNEYILWEGGNPWEEAWNRLASENKKLFVMIPLGDLDDMRQVKIHDVLARDYTVLKKMSDRYDAEHIIIAELEWEGDNVTAFMNPSGEMNIASQEMRFVLAEDDEIGQFFDQITRQMINEIESYREKKRKQHESIKALRLDIVINDSRDLVEITQALNNLELVESASVKEISSDKVVFEILHKESPKTMNAYLDTNGFVNKDIDGKILTYYTRQ